MRVVVVGGGIAGLSCAYYLRRREFDVTVVESNRIGSGASFANGGWLCPAQAGPLPEPGLTLYGMRTLLDRDSALYFQPAALPAARAVAAAVLDVLQRARPRARHVGHRAPRPRHLRPGRADARRRRRVRAVQAGHGVRRAAAPTTRAPSCASSQPMREHGYDAARRHRHRRRAARARAGPVGEGARRVRRSASTGTCGPTRSRPAWPTCCAATASTSARAPRWSSWCAGQPADHGPHRRRATSRPTSWCSRPGRGRPSWRAPLGDRRCRWSRARATASTCGPSVMPSHAILLGRRARRLHAVRRPHPDRRHDGVQRHQHAASTAAGSTRS